MSSDPGDRLSQPEADVLEQVSPVESDPTTDIYAEPVPLDVDPADVIEQRIEVPIPEDDYPAG